MGLELTSRPSQRIRRILPGRSALRHPKEKIVNAAADRIRNDKHSAAAALRE
jgi:hypothetical protein